MGTTTSLASGDSMTGDQRDPVPSHTPGPWIIESKTNGHGGFYVRGPDDDKGEYPIATVYAQEPICSGYGEFQDRFSRSPEGQPTATANALLIAAAPDLLSTLQCLMNHARVFGAFRDDMGEGIENYCNEVIAKAEGKS